MKAKTIFNIFIIGSLFLISYINVYPKSLGDSCLCKFLLCEGKNNIILELSIKKDTYKIFEPIDIFMRFINTGSENDTIWNSISIFCGSVNLSLFRNTVKMPDFHVNCDGFPNSKPAYILKPGDTVTNILCINGNGIRTESKDSSFLGWHSYFPLGQYNGYITFNKNIYNTVISDNKYIHVKTSLINSNSIWFEITGLNEEDKTILKLCNEKKYDEILEKYPDNDFIEYIYGEKIRYFLRDKSHNRQNNIGIEKDIISDEDFCKMVEDVIFRYPNSYNTITYLYIYIEVIIYTNPEFGTRLIKKINELAPDSFINSYINSRVANSWISDHIQNPGTRMWY